MPAPPPAVLLGGAHNAVSAARSLAATGVRVFALGHADDPAARSRACTFVDVGNGSGRTERCLAWLGNGAPDAVVLACDDGALELVARHRALLEEMGHRPMEANDEVVLAMLDKQRTYELARRAGIPTPAVASLPDRDAAVRAAATLRYPCGLKPLHAHVARRAGVARKLIVVDDAEELLDAYDQLSALGVETLATELIPGGDDRLCSYYSYLDADGRPLLHLTKRKFRQWPPHTGTGCYQITHWNPELAELGLRFFQAIGLRGLAHAEFKRDPRDGSYRLIECNHRFTAAIEQVRIAGIDLALLSYNRVAGRPLPPLEGCRDGVRLWDPVEDVRALIAYRREGALTVRGWARSLAHRQHFSLLRADDPGPTLHLLGRRVRGGLGELRRRVMGPAPRR